MSFIQGIAAPASSGVSWFLRLASRAASFTATVAAGTAVKFGRQEGRLIGLLGVVIVLFIAGLAGLMVRKIDEASRTSNEEHVQQLLKGVTYQLGTMLVGIDQTMRHSEDRIRDIGSPQQLAELAVEGRVSTLLLKDLFFIDSGGHVVASAFRGDEATSSIDRSDRDYFRTHLVNSGNGSRVSRPRRGQRSGLELIPVSQAVRRLNGELIGVLVAMIDVQALERIWADIGFRTDDRIQLISDDGEVWFTWSQGTVDQRSDGEGMSWSRPVPGWPLLVVATLKQATVDRAGFTAKRDIVISAAAGSILVGLFCLVLARRGAANQAIKARLLATIDAIPVEFMEYDRDQRLVLANHAARLSQGWSGDPIGKTRREMFEESCLQFRDQYPDQDWDGWLVKRVSEGDQSGISERIRPNGECGRLFVKDMPGGGRVVVRVDITESKRREAELAATRDRYRKLFEAIPYPMGVVDPETRRFLAVNDAAVEQYGWSRAEACAMTVDDLYVPDDLAALNAQRQQDGVGLSRAIRGLRHRKKDGTIIDVDTSLRHIEFDGRPAVLVMSQDITEAKRREAELAATQDRYRMLFEAIPYPMVVVTPDTRRFLAVNDAAVAQYGWSREENPTMVVDDLYVPEDLPALEARRQQDVAGRDHTIQGLRHRKKDGTIIDVDLSVRQIEFDGKSAVLVVAQDITARIRAEQARRAAEEQLRQAQKMEAVGQLTGGIAHDFNNILTVILANADALQEDENLDEGVAVRLDQIGKAVQRASDLTRQLLAFSRKQPLSPKRTDISSLVAGTGKLLRRTLGEHIEIQSVLADDLWKATIDRAQLESALVNLCVNARDAMPSGGKLSIETRNVTLHDDCADRNPDVAAGDYVVLTVSDTGTGMPPDVVAKAFEPFFTTKGVGKGTGLGLSMVYGFIKQSHGHIKIDSEVGRGTSFKVYLPRNDGLQDEAVHAQAHVVPRGTERILVVEDDAQVRGSVVQQLQDLGYSVRQAPDGTAGVASFEAAAQPYDLLLTDVMMPGPLNGKGLADEVARRWPTTKIVFMSGYAEDAIVHDGQLDAGVLLLNKPFRRSDLAQIVRQALDASEKPKSVMADAA
jgi:PAS domain S-box-containing protein